MLICIYIHVSTSATLQQEMQNRLPRSASDCVGFSLARLCVCVCVCVCVRAREMAAAIISVNPLCVFTNTRVQLDV